MIESLGTFFIQFLDLYAKQQTELAYAFLFACLAIVITYFAFFVLKAIATCVLAKRRGYKFWLLGALPYVNFAVLGKVAGPVRIFNIDVKNIGIVAAISAFILDAANVFFIVMSIMTMSSMPGTHNYLTTIYTLMNVLKYGFDIVFILSYFMLAYAIFGKYAPNKRLLFTLLSIIQVVFPILLLTIMKKKPYSNYDEYYKEEMAKRYGQSYNPYSNPFRTNENPFEETNNKHSKDDNYKDQNPFDEY